MIQGGDQWFQCSVDCGEVNYPAQVRVEISRDGNHNLIRVTMQPVARVLGPDMGQPMGGLEAVAARDLKAHGIPISLWVCRLSRQEGWLAQ